MSSVASINQNLRALYKEGCLKEAVDALLATHNTQVDSSTYIHLLQGCITKKALSEGKKIHTHIKDGGYIFAKNTFLQNTIINMYDKCGSLVDARNVLDNMTEPNVVSFNITIAAYRKHGFPKEALALFHKLERLGIQPDDFTISTILTVCANMGSLNHVLQIHGKIIRCGFQSNVFVMNTLIDMYGKSGRTQEAQQLFDRMSDRDVVSWTAIIGAYAQIGFVEKVLEIFTQMQLAGVRPNSVIFTTILPACAKMGALKQGIEIHPKIIKSGILSDDIVMTALIDMYIKCGSIHSARQLFNKMPQRDVVSCTAIISGYAQIGPVDEALDIFKQMQLESVKPNVTTFGSILSACAKLGALAEGKEIHQKIMELGFSPGVITLTALIDMYAKCGSIQNARKLFDKLPERNVVSWNTIITGYAQNGFIDEALRLFKEMPQQNMISWTAIIAGCAQNGLFDKALECFKQMQSAGTKPDSSTFASILPACAKLGALKKGMEIHQKVIESGVFSDVVATNLINMYAKCGNIQKARNLFDKMHHLDVNTWNAMIAGCAMHGYSEDALELFQQLKHSLATPDHISFVCVLYACSHTGLVDDGCKFFKQMRDSYHIMPTWDHYLCIMDLLGRAGYLEESLNFIIKLPLKPDVVLWLCLLGACRAYKNARLGEFVATLLFELDPENAAPYILLSNMYVEAGRWEDIPKLKKLQKQRGIKKVPGCSWIEACNSVHVFCVGDRSHPQTYEIYALLDKLSLEIKAVGYIPDRKPAMNDVEEEEKESLLCHHSEKLAIAFGLLNTPSGTTIRVVKNLRVCGDCHIATKFISKVVAREIVVRDANRFHHFKDGKCSCGDYW